MIPGLAEYITKLNSLTSDLESDLRFVLDAARAEGRRDALRDAEEVCSLEWATTPNADLGAHACLVAIRALPR